MSMCRGVSCVGRGCLLWPVCSLGKTLLAFALLHFVLQGQIGLLLQISLDFLLLHFKPLWWKGHLSGFVFIFMLVLEDLVGLHKVDQLLSGVSDWGIDLDYCDIEWLGLETNWDHSVIFEIVPKYCISDSLVTCDGYSISSKGFFPAVVDVMVIWIKFAHLGPF